MVNSRDAGNNDLDRKRLAAALRWIVSSQLREYSGFQLRGLLANPGCGESISESHRPSSAMTGCGHAGTVAAHQTGNTAMRARLRSAVEGNVRTLRSRSRACPLQMAEAGYTTVMMGRDRVGLPHAPTRSVCRANDWFANPVSGVNQLANSPLLL